MTKTEYLYGEDIEVPSVPAEVIEKRVELLRDNLAKLLEHSYHIRDTERCNRIFKAISFWEKINEA